MSDGRLSGLVSIGVTLAVVILLALQAATPRPEDQVQQTPGQVDQSAPERVQQERPIPDHQTRTLTAVMLPAPPRAPKNVAVERSSAQVETGPTVRREALKPASQNAAVAAMPKTFVPLRPIPMPETESTEAATPLKPLRPTAHSEVSPAPVSPKRPLVKPAPAANAANSSESVEDVAREASNAEGGTVVLDGDGVQQGRAMLRILEHGEGPAIEIAWPAKGAAREHLFQRFASCYGMRVALMDGDGRLFIADGKRRSPWSINLDRYSGYVRQASGVVGRAERQAIGRIRDHHGRVSGTIPVRIFPRHVDAVLLGGLRQLIGANYAKATTIRAAYRLNGGQVIIDSVLVDGRRAPGSVDLSRGVGRTCGV